MNIFHLLTATILLTLSGCAGVTAKSTLEYDGTASGAHSDNMTCDDQGKLTGSGTIADGEVMITLKDATGKQLFQQTFKGTFTLDERTLSGTSGTWIISAQRSGDDLIGDAFSGKYAFHVNC